MTDRARRQCASLVVLCLAFLVAAPAGRTQTIEIEPVAASRGLANILRLTLKPKADKPLTALQWEFIYPHSLRIEPAGVVTSGAVEASGKSVLCAIRPPRGSDQVLACILAGGVKPLAEGTIVIVRFVASQDAARGVANLRLEKIAAVSESSERVALENVKVPVTIR